MKISYIEVCLRGEDMSSFYVLLSARNFRFPACIYIKHIQTRIIIICPTYHRKFVSPLKVTMSNINQNKATIVVVA